MDKYCFHSCERPPIYYNFLLLPRIMSQRGRNSIPFLPHSITERHPLSPLTRSLAVPAIWWPCPSASQQFHHYPLPLYPLSTGSLSMKGKPNALQSNDLDRCPGFGFHHQGYPWHAGIVLLYWTVLHPPTHAVHATPTCGGHKYNTERDSNDTNSGHPMTSRGMGGGSWVVI